jgi:hypothetical protein
MRTPNTQCLLCKKPLYRRPSDSAKFRYVACIKCRSEAQKVSGITDKQLAGLALGREKGTNHLEGLPKSKASNKKRSRSHIKWCRDNPDKVAARGMKNRGENHYKWKGGVSNIQASIRRMTENRKWMDAVKERDGRKCICGSTKNIEAHHIVYLCVLIEQHKIKSREDAYKYKDILWDMKNGITLCRKCHYAIHKRTYADR